MSATKIINELFNKAVSGLTSQVLNDDEMWYNYIMNLPDKQRMVYTIGIFNQQVLNGGLHQYFSNHYGIFANETIKYLKFIKANKSAVILESAVILINEHHFSPYIFRTKISNNSFEKLNNFDNILCTSLESLDSEYYELNEKLEELMEEYLSKT